MANIIVSKRFVSVNGLRVAVRYSAGPWVEGVDPNTIKIRPAKGSTFPAPFRDAFAIENNSDSREDYFEPDCIRVLPGHPAYDAVATVTAALAAKGA